MPCSCIPFHVCIVVYIPYCHCLLFCGQLLRVDLVWVESWYICFTVYLVVTLPRLCKHLACACHWYCLVHCSALYRTIWSCKSSLPCIFWLGLIHNYIWKIGHLNQSCLCSDQFIETCYGLYFSLVALYMRHVLLTLCSHLITAIVPSCLLSPKMVLAEPRTVVVGSLHCSCLDQWGSLHIYFT